MAQAADRGRGPVLDIALQRHLHGVIRGRVEHLVDAEQLRLPEL